MYTFSIKGLDIFWEWSSIKGGEFKRIVHRVHTWPVPKCDSFCGRFELNLLLRFLLLVVPTTLQNNEDDIYDISCCSSRFLFSYYPKGKTRKYICVNKKRKSARGSSIFLNYLTKSLNFFLQSDPICFYVWIGHSIKHMDGNADVAIKSPFNADMVLHDVKKNHK